MSRKSDLVEILVEAAMSVLHHDGGEDGTQDLWERRVLTDRFRKIINEES